MKYFRKHPDLIFITNYPASAHRIRHGRQTTPQELSKILVQTIAAHLHGKKILLLTDAPDDKNHARLITRTSWSVSQPLSLHLLFSKLIYNYQTHTVCILYHSRLFGSYVTPILMPILMLFLRTTGKHVMIVFLTTPTVSTQPDILPAIMYFLRKFFRALLSLIASCSVTSKQSRAVQSLKKRKEIGKDIEEELFPSPTKNLGLLASQIRFTP